MHDIYLDFLKITNGFNSSTGYLFSIFTSLVRLGHFTTTTCRASGRLLLLIYNKG